MGQEMEYAYNKHALKIIRKAYGLKKGYIPKQIGIPVNTYSAWESGGMMSFQNLLKISNYLRISVFAFVSINGKTGPEDVVVPERCDRANFKPSVFCHSAMSTYLNKEKSMPISTICEKANIGTPSYYLYFPKDENKDSILQADKYFRLCNVFKVWPGSFVTNHGEDIPCLPGYEEALVVKNNYSIRVMNDEEKELVEMKRNISIATNSTEPLIALQKQYDLALESKLKIEKDKHARSRERLIKKIDNLMKVVNEQKETIADLRQQLKEARFYHSNYMNMDLDSNLIAAEPTDSDDIC